MDNTKPRTAIFIHIPKTAGTTLYGVIWRHYREDELYTIDGVSNQLADFHRLSPEKKAQIRLLSGHVNYGIHEQLPQSATYFTILREPAELVVSYYYYVRREVTHPLHPMVKSSGISLSEFLNSRVDESMSNVQTRFLAGKANRGTFYDCLPADLETAKRNLRDGFAVVGLTREFDTTLLLLQRAFGWKNLHYARMNVTPKRTVRKKLPGETLAAIDQANQLDIQLYQYAESLFQNQVRRCGDTFLDEVRAFQSRNRRRYFFYYLAWRSRERGIVTYRSLLRRLRGLRAHF